MAMACWRCVAGTVVAAGKRRQNCDLMEDEQPSSAEISTESPTPRSLSGTVSPRQSISGSGCASTSERNLQTEHDLPTEVVRVLAGRIQQTQQTGHGSQPKLETDSSTGTVNILCTTTTTTTISYSDSKTWSDDKTQRSSADPNGTKRDIVSGQSCGVHPVVECSYSLADRIDQARQCCSTVRDDIASLSTRCDALFSQLKLIRARLASPPYRQKCLTADKVTLVSRSTGVKQTSRSEESSRSFLNGVAVSCSSVAVSSRTMLNQDGRAVTASPRTSLNIIERFEKELSLRLDELTAYVSCCETPEEHIRDDIGTGEQRDFTETKEHDCKLSVEAAPVSLISEAVSNSVQRSVGSDDNSIKAEATFQNNTIKGEKGEATSQDNNSIKGEATFQDNRIKGEATFQDNNRIKGEATFEDNNRIKGEATSQDNNRIKGESTLKDNRIKGEATSQDNRIKGEANFKDNNRIKGEATSQDNRIKGEATFQDNRIKGEATFQDNNRIKREATFQDNNRIKGEATFQDNRIKREATFQDNNKIKGEATFQDNNRIKREATFQDNNRIKGEATSQDNRIKGEATFQDNRIKGEATFQDNTRTKGGATFQDNRITVEATFQDNNRIKGEAIFLAPATLPLTPPLSDESSSLDEDKQDRKQRPETVVLKPGTASWTGHADFMPATPVLYVQSFSSDCQTPAIEALTCLESFSDSGRLKLSLPMADHLSLQSSAMIQTPPLSDFSCGSEDQNSSTDRHSLPAPPLTQPDRASLPGQLTDHDSEESVYSTDCSESDWKDYYIEDYCSYPPHLLVSETSDPMEDQTTHDIDMKKSSTTKDMCEKWRNQNISDIQSNTDLACGISNTKPACHMAQNGFHMDAVIETEYSMSKSMSETNTLSRIPETMTHDFLEPLGESDGLDFNRSNYEGSADKNRDLKKNLSDKRMQPLQKSFTKSNPQSSSTTNEDNDKMDDGLLSRDSPEVPQYLTEVDQCQLIISTPPRSTCVSHKTKSVLNIKHQQLNITSTLVKSQETADAVKTQVNPWPVMSDKPHQKKSSIAKPVLPVSITKPTLNIKDVRSITNSQNSTTENESDTPSGAAGVNACTQSYSARTNIDNDSSGLQPAAYVKLPQNFSEPLASHELTPCGVNQTVSDNLYRQTPSVRSQECRPPGKWKPRQKRIRQHRSALHMQHLSMAKAQARCWSVSQVTGSIDHALNNVNNVMQSYSALEGMSCGFNFLRNRQSQSQFCLCMKDFNNNVSVPASVAVSHRNYFQTLYGNTQRAPEHKSFMVHNLNAHHDSAYCKIFPATDSTVEHHSESTISQQSSSPTQRYVSGQENFSTQHYSSLNKKRIVSLDELKTRMYKVTKVKSTEVGIFMKHYESARRNGENNFIEYFNHKITLHDKENFGSNTEANSLSSTKPQEQNIDRRISKQNSTFSEVKYSTMDTQKRCILSCIVEDESEGVALKSKEDPHDKVDRLLQTTETTVNNTKPVSFHSGTSRIRVFKEDSMLKNSPPSLTGESAERKQEATLTREKDKAVPESFSKTVDTQKQAGWDSVVSLSFDNHFGVKHPPASAYTSRNCEMLTSTPVVSGQKTRQADDGAVHTFFGHSHSVDQSCILEMSDNAHSGSGCSEIHPALENNTENPLDNEVKKDIVVACTQSADDNASSSAEQRRRSSESADIEIKSTSAQTMTKTFMNKNDRLSHTDIQSNLLASFNAAETVLTTTKCDSQEHNYSKDTIKASDAINIHKTFVIAPHTPDNDCSRDSEGTSFEQFETKIGDHYRNLSMSDFVVDAKGSESSCSNLYMIYENASNPYCSETQKRVKTSRVDKVLSEARTVEADSCKQNDLQRDGSRDPDENVTGLKEVKPRPKPLLPTPPYRHSRLSFPAGGGIHPCPHCLNHMLPAMAMFPPVQCQAAHWTPHIQGCGCAVNGEVFLRTHGTHMCQPRPKSPVEFCGSWGRGYNGPAASCVHHGGTSQPILPPHSASLPSDSRNGQQRSLCQLERPPYRHHGLLKGTAGLTAKPHLQVSRPEEFLQQPIKSETNVDHPQAVPLVKTGVSQHQASCCERGGEGMDKDQEEDVLPLLMLTWTLLMWSLTIAVHDVDTHCARADR